MDEAVSDAARDRLRSDLESLPGVRAVHLEPERGVVHLVCSPTETRPSIEGAARAAIARSGLDPDTLALEISFPAAGGTERRVRFVEVRLERPRIGSATATAVLEWRGERFLGRADGEAGVAIELRLCAQATVAALEAVMAGELRFDLLGLKPIRVFDEDLVAAILRCQQVPDRRLVGVALSLDDPGRAAALAVLNATNRLLGNYLVVPG